MKFCKFCFCSRKSSPPKQQRQQQQQIKTTNKFFRNGCLANIFLSVSLFDFTDLKIYKLIFTNVFSSSFGLRGIIN